MSVYYNPNDFPFLLPLKDNWEKIRSEYDKIKSNAIIWPEDFHGGKMEVIGLRYEGNDLSMFEHTPTIKSICSNSIFYTFGFSILRAGCEIQPHKGVTDKLLRCHLTLYSNDMCGIVVDGIEYNWKEGELMVFDDSYLHYAWNRASVDRVILLLDFFKEGNIIELEKTKFDYLENKFDPLTFTTQKI